MAKLFNVEGEHEIILKCAFIALALVAVVVSAFVCQKPNVNAENATENLVGIHVKGAVENSGYYEVPMGTRVCELSEYIGEFSPQADLDGINLAQYVKDGEEIYIPYKGTVEKGAVNLNTVTYEELLYVDGIGETYARKIINYRETHGGFKKVIELKSLLGTKAYESVMENFYVD